MPSLSIIMGLGLKCRNSSRDGRGFHSLRDGGRATRFARIHDGGMTENPEGRVSVIIPARNEESNIERAVRSVAAQQGWREIVVVDDQSKDATAKILDRLQKEIPALRCIRIESLPEGRMGKTHALAAGAKLASAEWLLFTDADTEHRPGSLAELVHRAENERADLLSLSPGQRTTTWWEKSIIPLVYVHLARLYRFEEVSDPRSALAAANGQYILVRRAVYERVGGHEAVRDEILEDVELARRIKTSGGRLLFLPGARWAETRMYASFPEMWNGWTKNLYPLYGRRLARVFRSLAETAFLELSPPVAFVALCLVLVFEKAAGTVVLLAAACFLAAAWQLWRYSESLRRLGFAARMAGWLVPGAGLFGSLLVNSVCAHRWRGRVTWKGRDYSTKRAMRGSE